MKTSNFQAFEVDNFKNVHYVIENILQTTRNKNGSNKYRIISKFDNEGMLLDNSSIYYKQWELCPHPDDFNDPDYDPTEELVNLICQILPELSSIFKLSEGTIHDHFMLVDKLNPAYTLTIHINDHSIALIGYCTGQFNN